MSDAEPQKPTRADFALTRAFGAHRDGRLDKAEAGYREVLALAPEHPDALHLLGVVLKNKGDPDAGEKLIRRAIELRPRLAAAHYNLGNLLLERGQADNAASCFRTAIVCDNSYAEAYYSLGNLQRDQGDFKAAISTFGLAIMARPDYAEARHNRANVLRELGRVDESVLDLQKVVAMRPDMPEGHYNLALSLFLQGRYAEGAPHYDWRFQTKGFSSPARHFSQPLWNGEPQPAKSVLLYAEQGLGDTLQFIRFARLARPRIGQLIVEVPAKLVRIVSDALGELAFVVAQGKPLPPFDLQAPLMNLIGRLHDDTVFPYLKPEPERVAKWAARLNTAPGLIKVGISWQGNPAAKIDKGRSLPLATLAPLAMVPGVRLISLQKNHGTEQLDTLPVGMKVETLGDDFDTGADAFLDAAAVLQNLDLFVTTDTALAHLAGALNRPTLLLLKHVPDWRWGLTGETTHWYKSVKILRQNSPGDWSEPIRGMVRIAESWQSGLH